MIRRKHLAVAVLAGICVLATLFAAVPIRGLPPVGNYSPWLDVNDDGKIDGKDLGDVAAIFGSSGQNLTKASLQYDSGWINITDKSGQSITVTHGLNIADWNDQNITVDITGKTLSNGGLVRSLGLAGQQGWSNNYGGTNSDEAHSLVQTNDRGFALAGITKSFGAGGWDFWLVKTDVFGDMQWNMTYGGTGDDYAYSMVQTSDGGYAIAGQTWSFGTGGDAWLVKTNSSGNLQWSKTYGGTGWDQANSVIQTTDGGYALAGRTASYGASGNDFWLVKTDSSGNPLWNKTYGGTFYDEAYSVVQTGDEGYAIAGCTGSYGAGGYDAWLVKTNSTGGMLWNKTYGGTDEDKAYSLAQAVDGSYALAGYTKSFGAGNYDFWLVKTDSSGNPLWNKTYGGTDEDKAYSLAQTVDGGYALAGYTFSFGVSGNDFWLVKTDTSGDALWNRTYGGTGNDWANSLVQAGDGGYALAGVTWSFGTGGDAWLVKTDASGNNGECGLVWASSTSNTITLYRGSADRCWNYVRVQIWKRK